LFSCCK
jgi:20S proteasome subunit alpha 5